MGTYTVRRGFETVATCNASGTSTAESAAESSVRATVEAAAGDALADLSVEAVDVYEFPSAPFEPFKITVRGILAVTVEADGPDQAPEAGSTVIDDALSAADLDGWEYRGDAELGD